MALDQYLQRTQLLLADPDFAKFNEGDLTSYVNMARGQIAGESECVRAYLTLAVSSATQQYPFSSINLGTYTTTVLGVLNVRQITYSVGTGQASLHPRSFPYFNTYILSQAAPDAGPPQQWSQFGQGANGTLFFNLLDNNYTCYLDAVCYPIPLVDDTTEEGIPYQWQDAVPFYAAYFASITIGNADKAGAMWGEYQKFMSRARAQATPAVLPSVYVGTPDPFMQNRLGLPLKG